MTDTHTLIKRYEQLSSLDFPLNSEKREMYSLFDTLSDLAETDTLVQLWLASYKIKEES